MPLKNEIAEEPNLNLTPMIDIVFLLIIFFMVGTRFADLERQYDIKLPEVAEARPLTAVPDAITVNIQQDGKITINGDTRSLEDLESDLLAAKQRFADQSIVIRADGNAHVQDAMEVLAVTKKVGIRNHSLAYRLKNENEQ
jgi:biopolymer transport protein ExbD